MMRMRWRGSIRGDAPTRLEVTRAPTGDERSRPLLFPECPRGLIAQRLHQI